MKGTVKRTAKGTLSDEKERNKTSGYARTELKTLGGSAMHIYVYGKHLGAVVDTFLQHWGKRRRVLQKLYRVEPELKARRQESELS